MKYFWLFLVLFLPACGSTATGPTSASVSTRGQAVVSASGSFIVGRLSGLWRLELPGQQLTPLLDLADQQMAFDPAISPDGAQIIFSYLGPVPTPSPQNPIVIPAIELAAIPATGGPLEVVARIPAPGVSLLDPSWSPDGQRLLVTEEVASLDPTLPLTYTLAEVNLGNGTLTPLIDDAASGSISPDGAQLVFVRPGVQLRPQLVLHNFASGSERVLVDDGRLSLLDSPRWTPDGTQIVFAGNLQPSGNSDLLGWLAAGSAEAHGGNWRVWRVPAAGGTISEYPAPPQLIDDPQLTLDGEYIYLWASLGMYRYRIADLTGAADTIYAPGDFGGIDLIRR